MGRSEAALQRRAEKRGISVEEMRERDTEAALKAGGSIGNAPRPRSAAPARSTKPVKQEPVVSPAPVAKPAASPAPSSRRPVKPEESSWPGQASADKVAHNKRLRAQLAEGGGELSPADKERAELLVARDERKKQKRKAETAAKRSQKRSQTGAPRVVELEALLRERDAEIALLKSRLEVADLKAENAKLKSLSS